jgi:hypothetical protein
MADQRLSTAALRLSVTPGGRDGAPSVEVAKQWLQQVILPRRVFSDKAGAFRLVEMGEDPAGSELFPVWGTSLADLSVFGIGIGMYFRMLLQLAVLTFVLAALSAPTIAYFASPEYSGALRDRGLDIRIWGTAACTRQLPLNATSDGNSTTISAAAAVSVGDGDVDTDAVVNDCPLVMTQLHVDMVALVILCGYCILAGLTQSRTKAYLDALAQTAADYSVVVKDPNANAWDPDEWRDFFAQFGSVKCVTVAVNNHALLSALAHKRYMEDMLRMESPDPVVIARALHAAVTGEDAKCEFPKTQQWTLRFQQAIGMHRNLSYWVWALHSHRARIAKLIKHEAYRVWSVFVMFEAEEAQRKCLLETRVGLCATALDCSRGSGNVSVPRFRGSNILHVEQAVEPSSVQWKNVGVAWSRRFRQQVVTVSVVCAMMVGVYFMALEVKNSVIGDEHAEASVRRSNLYILAYTLSTTDYVGCKVLSYLNLLEQHQTKEREQLSALNKLLLFRCFNGAVVMYLLMDFTDMLSQQNLLLAQAMLIANLVTIPALQLLSLYGRFVRWYFGPRAKTQRKLNSYYSGAYWQLAERYTQISKSVGIALFYKPILPTGLVITTVSLLVNYWVDKYCLLRKWKTPPKFDGLLARASRYHLLIMALASLVMMGHWYDGWPFDAPTESAITHAQHKEWSYTSRDSWVYWVRLIFPFPREYPSEDQTRLMRVLTVLLVVLTAATAVFLLLRTIHRTWRRYVVGSHYGHRAALSDTPASQVKDLVGYVPSYESWWSDFPYLCVSLSGFEHRLIDWSGNHSAYCLVDDVLDDRELAPLLQDRPIEQLFGACKQYPVDGDSRQKAPQQDDQEDERMRKCASSVDVV